MACRFDHNDEDRMPHKCNVTCNMSLAQCMQYMKNIQSTFTYLCDPDGSGVIVTRVLKFTMKPIPEFFSRTV